MTTHYHLHVDRDRLVDQSSDNLDWRPQHVITVPFEELQRLRALASFRALPWYRRAWLTLTGKAPR